MELRKSVNNLDNKSNSKKADIENFKKELLENLKKDAKLIKSKKEPSIHKDHRSRLKSQFVENGIDSLTDVQKLELLLFYAIPQKDTNPLAHKLINQFGSLKDVLLANYKDLVKIGGVKENTATFLRLISGMVNVFNRPSEFDTIGSSALAKEYASRLYCGISVEQFYVICLTKDNKIKRVSLISSGTADEVNVQIRNITETTIDSRCSRIIISHNHPRGYAQMSDEDCSFTYSLVCSCLLNSIEIIDHVIVGIDKAISLCEIGVLQKLKERACNHIQIPKEKQLFLSSLSEN